MQIRIATHADVPALVRLFRFYELVMEGKDESEVCDASISSSLSAYVASPAAVVLVGEHKGEAIGFFVGADIRHESSGKLMFIEVHWMCRPDRPSCGLVLKRTAEAIAKQRGASVMLMHSQGDRVSKILERSGYSPVTTMYKKDI